MNIMSNKPCNYDCDYCFANKEMTKTDDPDLFITMENFKKAVEFSIKSKEYNIGIIGGEPTLHPKIRKLIKYALDQKQLRAVTLFTNGHDLSVLDGLWSEKLNVVLNYNAMETIGKKEFQNVTSNIKEAFKDYSKRNRITLGVNMYKENFEYLDIIDTLKEINYQRELRVSIAVPRDKSVGSLQYFRNMKRSVFEFFKELDLIDIVPVYDCNLMPECITTREEKEWLRELGKKMKSKRPSNLISHSMCRPVLDVLPDLRAIRCFGMSEDHSVKIENFKNTEQIRGLFTKNIDNVAVNIPMDDECLNCKSFHTGQCIGGCLGFKTSAINSLRQTIHTVSKGVIVGDTSN